MKIWKDKRGISIVSVMVAFMILLIGVSMLYSSVMLSQKMIATASKQLTTNDSNMGKFYNKDSKGSAGPIAIGIYESGKSTAAFNIPAQVLKDENSGFYYFN